MSDDDRLRWDARYASDAGPAEDTPSGLVLEVAPSLPVAGRALDLACGQGQLAAWLAGRGLDVVAVDISPVGLEKVESRSRRLGVGDRVRGIAWDLETGLPPRLGEFDLVGCIRYHQPDLMAAARDSLRPGGMLLVEVLLSPEGDTPRFRASHGEALSYAGDLHVHLYREGRVRGRPVAQLVAQRPPLTLIEFASPLPRTVHEDRADGG